MSTGEFLLREPDWQDWLVVDEDGRPLPFARYPASRTMSGRCVSFAIGGIAFFPTYIAPNITSP